MLASIEIWRQMRGGQCGASSFDLGHEFEHHTKEITGLFHLSGIQAPESHKAGFQGGISPTNS